MAGRRRRPEWLGRGGAEPGRREQAGWRRSEGLALAALPPGSPQPHSQLGRRLLPPPAPRPAAPAPPLVPRRRAGPPPPRPPVLVAFFRGRSKGGRPASCCRQTRDFTLGFPDTDRFLNPAEVLTLPGRPFDILIPVGKSLRIQWEDGLPVLPSVLPGTKLNRHSPALPSPAHLKEVDGGGLGPWEVPTPAYPKYTSPPGKGVWLKCTISSSLA